MKLNAAIICKNEEAMIERCLKSLNGIDEIIVVDTGSTDKTLEIVKKYTDKIFHFEWNDSFCDARNQALSHCTGDFAISIDADEFLPEGEIEKIRKEIENIGEFDALACKLSWDADHYHSCPRVFKLPNKWIGDAHEYITCNAKASGINITYTKSPTHDIDPDRNKRILEKSIKKNNDVRSKYYLAHDYFDRLDWENALKWYLEYLKEGTWRYEKSDAHLRVARCLFYLQRGDEARDHCLDAILLNPNFKEAYNFMASLSWEKEAKVWRKHAKLATNEDVLFLRK